MSGRGRLSDGRTGAGGLWLYGEPGAASGSMGRRGPLALWGAGGLWPGTGLPASGEGDGTAGERRGGDSNPRTRSTPVTRFPVAPVQPLRHLSGTASVPGPRWVGGRDRCGGSLRAGRGGWSLWAGRGGWALRAGSPVALSFQSVARRARFGTVGRLFPRSVPKRPGRRALWNATAMPAAAGRCKSTGPAAKTRGSQLTTRHRRPRHATRPAGRATPRAPAGRPATRPAGRPGRSEPRR